MMLFSVAVFKTSRSWSLSWSSSLLPLNLKIFYRLSNRRGNRLLRQRDSWTVGDFSWSDSYSSVSWLLGFCLSNYREHFEMEGTPSVITVALIFLFKSSLKSFFAARFCFKRRFFVLHSHHHFLNRLTTFLHEGLFPERDSETRRKKTSRNGQIHKTRRAEKRMG